MNLEQNHKPQQRHYLLLYRQRQFIYQKDWAVEPQKKVLYLHHEIPTITQR